MNKKVEKKKEVLDARISELSEALKSALKDKAQFFADRIMATMQKHGANELCCGQFCDAGLEEFDEIYDPSYMIYHDEDHVEFYISRMAIIDGQLMIRSQEWSDDDDEYLEESEDWLNFVELAWEPQTLEDKEFLVTYLEDSDEAFDWTAENPDELVLDDDDEEDDEDEEE